MIDNSNNKAHVPYDVIDVRLKIKFASVRGCTGDLLQCVVKMADS